MHTLLIVTLVMLFAVQLMQIVTVTKMWHYQNTELWCYSDVKNKTMETAFWLFFNTLSIAWASYLLGKGV